MNLHKIKFKPILVAMLMIFNLFSIAYADGEDIYDINKLEKKQREEEEEKRQQLSRDYNVGVTLEASFPTLTKDKNYDINIVVNNNGGVNIEKATMKISSLPEGISLKSESSLTQDVGVVNVGHKSQVTYNIVTSNSIKDGTYPITFELKAKYGTQYDNYKDYSTTKTFYIKIKNNKVATDNTNYKPFIISDVSHVASINEGEVADLSFKITNPNSEAIDSVKITVEPEEGLVNSTQAIFIENNFSAGASKTYTVKLFGKDKAQKKNYSVKMTVESALPPSSTQNTTDDDKKTKSLPSSSQYTGIFYNAPKEKDPSSDKDSTKNKPMIMVQNYTYGNQEVLPNSKFPLTMTFINTSSNKAMTNIKISLSDDGTFTPVNSSNSFFIGKLSPKESASRNLVLSVKPDAETKTYPLNIDYIYQDESGNEITAKDTISIPVMQKTLLQIDEITKPQDVMTGEPVTVSTSFYNLGKTKISNIKVVGSGDFEVSGEPSYFVGSLEAGKSDSFSLTVTPKDEKKVTGTFTFTYETLDGQTHTVEKPFDFEMSPIELPPMDDEMMPKEQTKKNYVAYIIGGIAIIAVVAVIIKKKKNKKKMQELDLDE